MTSYRVHFFVGTPPLSEPLEETLTINKNILPSAESPANQQVLVVEDDYNSQRLIEFMTKGKYRLSFAVSVAKAKQQLRKHKIDLVLLDLSLAGDEDGLDLVRWMRQSTNWEKTPVIATTAHAFAQDRDNCISAGCNDFLSKPIQREKLLKIITNNI